MAHHKFSSEEIEYLRKQLLTFYNSNKRELPWRTLAKTIQDENQRAYSVWVSEIMLQQTQVATVINYFNKWITKWPTVADLAKATLEEVNEMWSGLGYYSRGRRLHEGAQSVMKVNGGKLPSTAKTLMKQLPGVGRYTAGAVASIAFNEITGVVDGNVIRVVSRLRMIGGDISTQAVNELIWGEANRLVDPDQPGDFNQAMMELGATVCTPLNPKCSTCPLTKICKAYYKSDTENLKVQSKIIQSNEEVNTDTSIGNYNAADIEDVPDCKFCLSHDQPWDPVLGVTNYPRKPKKKPPKAEKFIAVILNYDGNYLFTQRSDKGLLAGMWEFPLIPIENVNKEEIEANVIRKEMKRRFLVEDLMDLTAVGEVSHVFSHRIHSYQVYRAALSDAPSDVVDSDGRPISWMSREDSEGAAITKGIKKIIELNDSIGEKSQKRRRSARAGRGQRTLDEMFSKKAKK